MRSLKDYEQQMGNILTNGTLSDAELQNTHNNLRLKTVSDFAKSTMGSNVEEYRGQLEKKLDDIFEGFIKQNNKKTNDLCEEVFINVHNDLTDKMKRQEITELEVFKQ